MSITIADYVLVPPAVVTIELKGAALDYFRQDRSRAVYKNKATLPGYIVAAAEDPNTRGKHFKVFLPEGVHFGWCDRQADDTIALFNKHSRS